ncbi:MAG: adenylyl-sulfate kinase, partial [Vibrio sp.]
YEAPLNPDIDLPAGEKSVDELVVQCLYALAERDIIQRQG